MVSDTASHLIIRTKLRRPPVPSDHVHRPRLLEELEKGRERPFTLISAAAGYGKSTLASCWLATCDCPGAWLSLDEDDNDLRMFLTYFLEALQTLFPSAGLETMALLKAASLPPVSVLAGTLLNELELIDQEFILVLDDVHLIHEPSVLDLLPEMLRHPTESMHLVLAGRRDPSLPISGLRARGLLTEIRTQDLRFTEAETVAFLGGPLAGPAGQGTAAAWVEATEGWVTGLRLAALFLSQQPDAGARLLENTGVGPYVMEYLFDEVLAGQAPAVRQYLLRSAILDRFCAPLCDVVRESDVESGAPEIDGQGFIAWLQASNLFLIPLDTETRWFRYHHLFQALLQRQLKRQCGSEEVAALHSRSSEWFAENGFIEEAIRHALAADDVIGAAQLVEQNRQAMLDSDRWFVLEKWLSRFPDAVIQQRPGLLMARAWVHYHHFDYSIILVIMDAVEHLLSKATGEQLLRGEIDFFRGYIYYFQNEGSRSLKHLQAALERVPETYQEVRGQIETLQAVASQMEGRKEEAIHTLNDLLYRCPLSQSLRRTRQMVALVYIHLMSGDLKEALVANQRLYAFATKGNYAYAKVWSEYLQGLIHFYRNDLEEAIESFQRVMEQKYILQTRAAVDGMAGLAFSHQATRQHDKADETMQQLSDYVDSLPDPTYSMIARLCHARLSIMRGKRKSVLSRLQESPPAENNFVWIEIPAVTYCRVLLAEGSDESLEKAERRLRELLQLNQDNHNTLHMTEIMALLALAYSKQDRTDEALETLGRAIELAEPGGFIRPFVEPAPPMADLLKRLKKQNEDTDFIDQILATFKEDEKRVAQEGSGAQAALPPAMRAEPLIEPLTSRELETLGLLLQGLYRKEIAEKLCISPETVKTHLKNVYQKLGVRTRREAVARAAALGDIPGL